jgi:UDP-N-acetylenolpyruvoylglucosamine reductase
MEHIPFRLIGRRANLLVSDTGYDGLAIVMKNDSLEWEGSSVIAGAGVKTDN